MFIKLSSEDLHEDQKHMLSCIIGLLLNTIPSDNGESAVSHERVIFKFIENNFEKLQRLIELHIEYSKNLHDFEL